MAHQIVLLLWEGSLQKIFLRFLQGDKHYCLVLKIIFRREIKQETESLSSPSIYVLLLSFQVSLPALLGQVNGAHVSQ